MRSRLDWWWGTRRIHPRQTAVLFDRFGCLSFLLCNMKRKTKDRVCSCSTRLHTACLTLSPSPPSAFRSCAWIKTLLVSVSPSSLVWSLCMVALLPPSFPPLPPLLCCVVPSKQIQSFAIALSILPHPQLNYPPQCSTCEIDRIICLFLNLSSLTTYAQVNNQWHDLALPVLWQTFPPSSTSI